MCLTKNRNKCYYKIPRYRDPATGEIKRFPFKQLVLMKCVFTGVNGKELTASWMWEGPRKDIGIETKSLLYRFVSINNQRV
jgi:hypothetical protein